MRTPIALARSLDLLEQPPSGELCGSFQTVRGLLVKGYKTYDSDMMYFGALQGKYAEDPEPTIFRYCLSWDASVNRLEATYTGRDDSFQGIRLGEVEDFSGSILDFSGENVSGFRMQATRYATSMELLNDQQQVTHTAVEIGRLSLNRLITHHVDIFTERLLYECVATR